MSGLLQHIFPTGAGSAMSTNQQVPSATSPGVSEPNALIDDYCACCDARRREGEKEKFQITTLIELDEDAWKSVIGD